MLVLNSSLASGTYNFCTVVYLFFFNDTATTEIYNLSLHDALPICDEFIALAERNAPKEITLRLMTQAELLLDEHRPDEALKILQSLTTTGTRQPTAALRLELKAQQDRKSTRLNSSHGYISYAVFCL